MRPGLGTTFIIDLWFTGIILAGLLASAFFRGSRIPSVAGTAALAAYVGFQYLQKQDALAFGLDYARANSISGARVDAQPRPVSPFNWTVFVSDAQVHRYSHINLVRTQRLAFQPGDGFVARLDSPYLPREQAVWAARSRFGETDQAFVREAWNSDGLAFFRWFADLPALVAVTGNPRCAWFADLRFMTPGRDAVSFQYGACRDGPAAPWQAYERDRPGKILRR